MSILAKISSSKLRNLFRSKWPGINTLWITDKQYIVPELKNIRKLIEKVSVFNLPYRENISECEDFALLLMAAIRKYRIEFMDLLPEEERFNYAFGICGLSKYKGAPYNHTVCFCVTNKGLYMFDAQFNDEGWKASDKEDDVYAMFV